jgi:hypothetical protein
VDLPKKKIKEMKNNDTKYISLKKKRKRRLGHDPAPPLPWSSG